MFNRFRLTEQGKNRFSCSRFFSVHVLLESAVDNSDRSAYRVITPLLSIWLITRRSSDWDRHSISLYRYGQDHRVIDV